MAHKTLEVVLAECQACCNKLSLSVHEVSDAPDASSRLTILGQSLVMASCKAELGELPASSIGAPAQSRRDTASALSPSLMTVSSLSYSSSGEPSSCKETTNRVKEARVDEHFEKEGCTGASQCHYSVHTHYLIKSCMAQHTALHTATLQCCLPLINLNQFLKQLFFSSSTDVERSKQTSKWNCLQIKHWNKYINEYCTACLTFGHWCSSRILTTSLCLYQSEIISRYDSDHQHHGRWWKHTKSWVIIAVALVERESSMNSEQLSSWLLPLRMTIRSAFQWCKS